MGILDRLTGTRYPETGVATRSAAEVRAALLAVNGPDVPFVVRHGAPSERADLVAVWRVRELGITVRARMRLVPAQHEVRALSEQWDAKTREYSRGQMTTVARDWTIERGDNGRPRMAEGAHFDFARMKDPLRGAVLDAGWTWRGVVFRL
ncbi:hypothetical protein A8W25_12805 [Streptomyces sp. ERV7]|uniref:hypothetical protein n=1 Tax=Streptomyces sp. ERV7 TaxID=1322334 RepID=UPI0007F48A47|nr:hypothetical protein [Streptomyces sp. ERV7]OAR26303.1 hypothetical protein A8W25_12805 [Streptomyces sp. ERV7]